MLDWVTFDFAAHVGVSVCAWDALVAAAWPNTTWGQRAGFWESCWTVVPAKHAMAWPAAGMFRNSTVFLLCHWTPMVLAVHCAPSHYLHQRLHGNCKSAAGETNPLLNLETFNAHSMCADAAPCICASSQTYGSCTSPAQSNLVTTTTPVTTHSSINKSVTVYVLFEC